VHLTRELSDESYRRGQGVPPYDASIEATLTPDGDQTILAIEVRGMPLDKIAFYGAGWRIHAERLARHIAGQERGETEARWADLVTPLPRTGGRHQVALRSTAANLRRPSSITSRCLQNAQRTRCRPSSWSS
jgi:hypothetical protein